MVTGDEPNTETVLGVIDNAQFPAQENKPIYSLVFTSERFIATLLAAESESLMRVAAIDGIMNHPDRRLRFKSMVKGVSNESYELKNTDPASILGIHKGSFAVPYSQLRRIKIRRGGLLSKPYIKFFSYERDYFFRLLNNLGKAIDKNTFTSYLDVLESTGIKEVY